MIQIPNKTCTSNPMPDHHYFDAFFDMMSAERGAAANTIAAYRRDLKAFQAFLTKKNIKAYQATQDDVSAYISDMHTRHFAASSVGRHLSAIRHFYKFLISEDICADDPTQHITRPKKAHPLPKTLSHAQIDALFAALAALPATTKAEQKTKLRMTCLVELLYATGIRVSELVSLPRGAYDGKQEMLLVKGKGGRERIVPLSDAACRALQAWIKIRDADKTMRHAPFLFPGREIKSHLTRQRFWQLLKALAQKANIDERHISPHIIRHAFATHLVEGGADLRAVQQLLGHADISTTQIYTHILETRKRTLLEKYHPMAQES